jgi:hypothetical protein
MSFKTLARKFWIWVSPQNGFETGGKNEKVGLKEERPRTPATETATSSRLGTRSDGDRKRALKRCIWVLKSVSINILSLFLPVLV